MGISSFLRSIFGRPSASPAPAELPSVGIDVMVDDDSGAAPNTVSYGKDSPFKSREAFDQIVNWMSGQGGINDPATATEYLTAATLNFEYLRNMLRASWLARKIVWKKPRDILRSGYSLIWEGSGDKEPKKRKNGKGGAQKNTEADAVRYAIQRKWNADEKVVQAMAWGRQFGGAVIVFDIAGQDMLEPLPIVNGMVDYSSVTKGSLRGILVFDRWRSNHDGVIDEDPASPNRGRPMYHVLTQDGSLIGQRVHWTRVVRFDGDKVDWWSWRANACWDDSVLQCLIDSLKQYDMTVGAISALIPRARQDVIFAKNAGKAASTESGQSSLAKRYAATARLASMYNVAVYDLENEKSEQRTFNFGGLDKIWEKSMKEVAGATGYPVSVLFGDEPAGLNATGDASLRNYYDDLAAERESTLKSRHLAVLEVITRNELGYLPDGFSVEYKPFWQASETEQATINKARADADHVRIQDGVITPGLAAREAKELSIYKTMTTEDVENAELEIPDIDIETGEGDEPLVSAGEKTAQLTPTAQASIMTVNEARAKMGLPAWPDSDGNLTVAEFQAKHGGVIAEAVQAESGKTGEEGTNQSNNESALDGFDPSQPRDPDGKWSGGGATSQGGQGSQSTAGPNIDLTKPARVPKETSYVANESIKAMEKKVRELSRNLWRESVAKSDIRAESEGRPAPITEEKGRELHEEHSDYMLRVQREIRKGKPASIALDPRHGVSRNPILSRYGIAAPTSEQMESALKP